MFDKTRLELDVEHHEKYRIPISFKILTVFLITSLLAVCLYTFQLKQNLSKKEHEIALMKDNFRKEKVELLGRIKKLEEKQTSDRK
jgi:hypothetical protein